MTRLEFMHRLEYLSSKIESTLSSARDANNVLIEEMRSTIKEFLQKSFEESDYVKTISGNIANTIFLGVGVILPDDWSKELGKTSMGIMEERKADKDNLKCKFDLAISNIDRMSATKLDRIIRILKKYDLERILYTINAECVEVKPIRKQNTTKP